MSDLLDFKVKEKLERETQWLNSHVQFLQGLNKRDDCQNLLLMLISKPVKTEDDQSKIDVLVAAVKSKNRSNNAEIRAKKLASAYQANDKKARDHKLIVAGTLFEISELLDEDYDTRLGFLLNFYTLTSEEKEQFRLKGHSLLAQRAADQKAKQVAKKL